MDRRNQTRENEKKETRDRIEIKARKFQYHRGIIRIWNLFFFKFIARKLKRLCECYPVIGVRSSGRNFARIHCANYFNNTAICKPLVCKKTDTKLTIDISRPFDVFYEKKARKERDTVNCTTFRVLRGHKLIVIKSNFHQKASSTKWSRADYLVRLWEEETCYVKWPPVPLFVVTSYIVNIVSITSVIIINRVNLILF